MIPLRLEAVTKRFGAAVAVKPGESARVHLAPEAIRVFVREMAAVRAAGAKTAGE